MKYFILLISIFFSSISIAQVDTSPNPENQIFTIVEKMPSFPGGTEAMIKFIQANIIYPKLEKENSITGTCYITVVVEKDGSLSGIKVIRGVTGAPDFDQEAIRVVSIMPKWIPGSQNGILVRVQYNLPIKFSLR